MIPKKLEPGQIWIVQTPQINLTSVWVLTKVGKVFTDTLHTTNDREQLQYAYVDTADIRRFMTYQGEVKMRFVTCENCETRVAISELTGESIPHRCHGDKAPKSGTCPGCGKKKRIRNEMGQLGGHFWECPAGPATSEWARRKQFCSKGSLPVEILPALKLLAELE